uniref:Uncharacterized protein n=1 Tax=Panagrolaimus superbus TaxID=310955 RepID=A0A914XW23_9BILA
MRRPLGIDEESFRRVCIRKASRLDRISLNYHHDHHRVSRDLNRKIAATNPAADSTEYETPQVKKAFQNVCFIAELMKKKDRDEK